MSREEIFRLIFNSSKWLIHHVPWEFWFVFGLFFLIQIIIRVYRYYRVLKSNIKKIDKMEGKEFEEYLCVIFKKAGYKVINTPYSGDFGGDLVVEKDKVRTIIQAKRYNGKVGLKAVQEAYTSRNIYKCTNAAVITNSYFTKQASKLAEANGVMLWDRDLLIKYILKNN